MPSAKEILDNAQFIANEGMALAILVRLLLAGLVAYSIAHRRIYPALFAGYVSLVLVSASLMAIGWDQHPNLFIFIVLFPFGLLWGREALLLPPRTKASWMRVAPAPLCGLAAFFYPHFTSGWHGPILFAPLGIVPCPTLLAALAAVMLTGRAFSLYAVAPTWALGMFFGLMGVFFLKVQVDWALVAAVPVSMAVYIASPAEAPPAKSKKLSRRAARAARG